MALRMEEEIILQKERDQESQRAREAWERAAKDEQAAEVRVTSQQAFTFFCTHSSTQSRGQRCWLHSMVQLTG